MQSAVIEGPVYYGVHHHLHHVENGVLIRRTRERLSAVADREVLDLTVANDEGTEVTVRLDTEQVGNLITMLPALREWMLTGRPAGE